MIGCWKFNTIDGEMISHFHNVQNYFHEKRVLIDDLTNIKCFNNKGDFIFSYKNVELGHYSQAYASININKKCGFVDLDGKIIIEPQFDSVWNFHEGLASVKIGKK